MLKNTLLQLFRRRKANRLDPRPRNPNHLARLDLANILRIQQIKRARLARHQPRIAELAQIQRPKSARIAHRIQFIRRQHQQRIRTFNLIQRIAQRSRKIPRLRSRQQMHDHFRIAVRLKNRSAMFQPAPVLRRIRQISVVAQRHFALVAIDQDRLRIQQCLVARRRIPRVPDRRIPRQRIQHVRLKNFFDLAHRAMQVQIFPVARYNSRRLLPSMLQCIQPEIRELRRFFVSESSEHTTLIVKTVVSEGELVFHKLAMHKLTGAYRAF